MQVHAAPLPDDQVTVIGGLTVTSLARTVLDLCRTVPIEQAVAAGDRALASGLVREVLEDCLVLHSALVRGTLRWFRLPRSAPN